MKKNLIRKTLFILAALLVFAPSCWAKSKGYFYIIGYSVIEKKAFFAPTLIQNVASTSYNDEEYATDVGIIRKLESQFQGYLSRMVNLDTGQYTVSARGAYKSEAIANNKSKDEAGLYEAKGFAVKIVKDFKVSD